MEEDGNRSLQELRGAIEVLGEKVDTLVSLHRDMIKWLLIVVCVIALGRSAFDLLGTFFGDAPPIVEIKQGGGR